MRKKLRLLKVILLLGLSHMAWSSDAILKYEVTVVDFHDPGYFRVQYLRNDYELWFHYRTFQFEKLNSMSHRFPITASLEINNEGQFLTIDDKVKVLVSGTQIADATVSECFDIARTTADFVECSSAHYLALKYQRDGLMAYLKSQEVEPELKKIIQNIEISQAQVSIEHQELLKYIDSTRSMGSIFRHQYYEEQFILIKAQIAQLDFILSNY